MDRAPDVELREDRGTSDSRVSTIIHPNGTLMVTQDWTLSAVLTRLTIESHAGA
jgi:hypothetical protein